MLIWSLMVSEPAQPSSLGHDWEIASSVISLLSSPGQKFHRPAINQLGNEYYSHLNSNC